VLIILTDDTGFGMAETFGVNPAYKSKGLFLFTGTIEKIRVDAMK
jgi:hypothetical protein